MTSRLGWPGSSAAQGDGLGWPDVSRETSRREAIGSGSLDAVLVAAEPEAAAVPDGDRADVAVADAPSPLPEAPPLQDAEPVSRETWTPDDGGGETPIAAAAAAALSTARARALPFPTPAQPRRLVVANQKGGVGKTTTTVNVAAALAQHGLRVLVLDLDPQGNASTAFGIDHHASIPSIYNVLIEDLPLAAAAVEVAELPGLVCVPATIDLAGAEIELVSVVARESRLKRALSAYEREFDYILIDCPPSLGLLTVNALVAGEEVFIPIQCEYYALEGLGQLLRNVELVKAHLNPDLVVSTILLTMYDARTRLAEQVAGEVRQHFGPQVLDTTIPRSVRISEAPGYGQTVVTYDPMSRGAGAYIDAAREIADRGAEGVPQ